MKEIGLSDTIARKRRERGLTQGELAAYVGVTKASVSKWETGSSYPDILFLPKLAAYFSITIDELMCYTPQMSKEEILKTYQKFREDFGKKPFADVKEECNDIIRNYYSCLPLLMQMGKLYMNHHMLAQTKEEAAKTLEEASELCDRVIKAGEDAQMTAEARLMKAVIFELLEKPEQVLELLGEDIKPNFTEGACIIRAFWMQGNMKKAQELLQISLYSYLNEIMETMGLYLQLNQNDKEKSVKIIEQSLLLVENFHMESVFANAVIRFYYQAATVLAVQGENEEALRMLEAYTRISVEEALDFSFHGDGFFDSLDDWFHKIEKQNPISRSQDTINDDLLKGLSHPEVFKELQGDVRYQNLLKKLRSAVNHE